MNTESENRIDMHQLGVRLAIAMKSTTGSGRG